MPNQMKIGELAKLTGCPIETIRYYEQEGLLLPPLRSEANYRLYGDAHVDRLSFIRNCRSLDMTLDEIRSLLAFRDQPEQNCGEVNELIDTHIAHVAGRIVELKALEKQLKDLRHLCDQVQTAEQCGILHKLEAATPQRTNKNKAGMHVQGPHKHSPSVTHNRQKPVRG